jgi:hypothetical protein
MARCLGANLSCGSTRVESHRRMAWWSVSLHSCVGVDSRPRARIELQHGKHALDAQGCERDSCHLFPHRSLIFPIHTPPLPGVGSESTADPVNLTGWYSFAVKCVGPPCTRSHCNCGSNLAKGNCNQGQSEEECAVNISKTCQEFVPNAGAWCPHCSTLV